MDSPEISLRDTATIRAGFHPRTEVRHVPGGSHALIQARDVQVRDFDGSRSHLDGNALVRISPGTVKDDLVLRENDVLFLAKGSHTFAFVPPLPAGPVLAASCFFILRPEGNLLPGYLSWYLNLPQTRDHLSRLATGRKWAPVIRRDVLEELRMPLPPLGSQEKVVELDSLMRRELVLHQRLVRHRKDLLDQACLLIASGIGHPGDTCHG